MFLKPKTAFLFNLSRQFFSEASIATRLILGGVVVVLVWFSLYAGIFEKREESSRAEIEYAEYSPLGREGGSVIPASCPSDPHTSGECNPPPPPINPTASCVNHTATMTWTEPAGTTYSALRLHDIAYSWTGQCGSDGAPGNWCWDTRSPRVVGGLHGTYNWWVHACNANGCGGAAWGPSFSCEDPKWIAYCTGSGNANPANDWQWWEKTTNTNPIEYRYLRPGDGSCTASQTCPNVTRYWTTNACNPGEIDNGLTPAGRTYYVDLDACNPVQDWVLHTNNCLPTGQVRGYKVDRYRQAAFAEQTITVQGGSQPPSGGTNPYFITGLTPTWYDVTTTVPPGYIAGYCVGTQCGGGQSGTYTRGSSVNVAVPAGGAIDVWWMYIEPNQIPFGYFDSADCNAVRGWAYDPDNPSSSIYVNVYDGGNFLFTALANSSRADVNSVMGITGDHGFDVATPASIKDGIPHTLTVQGIDFSTGDRKLLFGQHTVSCSSVPPVTPPTVDLYVRKRTTPAPTWSSSASITAGEHVDLKWDSSVEATECQGDTNFSTRGLLDGETLNNDTDVAGEPAAGLSQTYTVRCRNGAGPWVYDTVLVGASAVPLPQPTLAVDKNAVARNGQVNVTATLNGHTGCVIDGAQIDPGNTDFDPVGEDRKRNVSSGVAYLTGPIVGRTTFTLTCSSWTGFDSETVEVRPMFSEE